MALGTDFTRVLAAAKTGAEWAWAAIYRDLAGPVTAYLAVRGIPDPEDIASEVFLHVARDLYSFEGDEAGFRSWVFVIAHRRMLDFWRASGRRPKQTTLDDTSLESVAGDTEDEAVERLATKELLTTFRALTADQKSVLVLRIIGGLSLAETARILGRRVGAIKALQRRALLALEKAMRHAE